VDPNWFFPERGESHRSGKKVCATCPVIIECAEYRERSGTEFGMWGGQMTKRRRKANEQAAEADPDVGATG
jgi:WhiB family transcriptional regulator, redox-sensing transcriptional regulator